MVIDEDARQERDTVGFYPWETPWFNITDAAKGSVASHPGLAEQGRLTNVYELSSLGAMKDCLKKIEQFAWIVLRSLVRAPAQREDNLFLLLRHEPLGYV